MSNYHMFLSTQTFNCTSFSPLLSINTCKINVVTTFASIGPFDKDQVAISYSFVVLADVAISTPGSYSAPFLPAAKSQGIQQRSHGWSSNLKRTSHLFNYQYSKQINENLKLNENSGIHGRFATIKDLLQLQTAFPTIQLQEANSTTSAIADRQTEN